MAEHLATGADVADVVNIVNAYFALRTEFAHEPPWDDAKVQRMLRDPNYIITLDTDCVTVWVQSGREAEGSVIASTGSTRAALQRLAAVIKLALQTLKDRGVAQVGGRYTFPPSRDHRRTLDYFAQLWGMEVGAELLPDGSVRATCHLMLVDDLLAKRGW